MQIETCDLEMNARHNEETGIISEVVLEFAENSGMTEGMCSCVCINDERCCGCLMQ